MKGILINRIYSRHERNGHYYIIARIKRDGIFSMEEIEVTQQQFKTLHNGERI